MSRAGYFLKRFDEGDLDPEDFAFLQKRISKRKEGEAGMPHGNVEPGKVYDGSLEGFQDENNFDQLNHEQLVHLAVGAMDWMEDSGLIDDEAIEDTWNDLENLVADNVSFEFIEGGLEGKIGFADAIPHIPRHQLLTFLTDHFANMPSDVAKELLLGGQI